MHRRRLASVRRRRAPPPRVTSEGTSVHARANGATRMKGRRTAPAWRQTFSMSDHARLVLIAIVFCAHATRQRVASLPTAAKWRGDGDGGDSRASNSLDATGEDRVAPAVLPPGGEHRLPRPGDTAKHTVKQQRQDAAFNSALPDKAGAAAAAAAVVSGAAGEKSAQKPTAKQLHSAFSVLQPGTEYPPRQMRDGGRPAADSLDHGAATKYMWALYNKFSTDRYSHPMANIVRSFKSIVPGQLLYNRLSAARLAVALRSSASSTRCRGETVQCKKWWVRIPPGEIH